MNQERARRKLFDEFSSNKERERFDRQKAIETLRYEELMRQRRQQHEESMRQQQALNEVTKNISQLHLNKK
jgi:hypothetical protein